MFFVVGLTLEPALGKVLPSLVVNKDKGHINEAMVGDSLVQFMRLNVDRLHRLAVQLLIIVPFPGVVCLLSHVDQGN